MFFSHYFVVFQKPKILLFDIFEPRSGDGVSTDGIYPYRLRGFGCAHLR